MARNYRTFSATEIAQILQDLADGKSKKEICASYDVSKSTIGTFAKNFSGRSLAEIEEEVRGWDKYKKIFRALFNEKFVAAEMQHVDLPFTTGDLARWQSTLGLEGGNPYDLKYNSKGRGALPPEVQATAPEGQEWRIKAVAKGRYVFKLYEQGAGVIDLDADPIVVKVPDSLPAIVERYARKDEQSLLARIRYNNLVSVFLGLSTYSLQSHWKTSAEAAGGSPVEVDEMYVGLDSDGVHYVIPVEAKGREKSEKLTTEQILTNYMAARETFPDARIVAVAAKVIDDYTFAMIRFSVDEETESVEKEFERHYTLAINPPVKGHTRPVLTGADVQANATAASARANIEAGHAVATPANGPAESAKTSQPEKTEPADQPSDNENLTLPL